MKMRNTLIAALAIATITALDVQSGSLDGPLFRNKEVGDEWAPQTIMRLNPDTGYIVTLDRKDITDTTATYRVKVGTPPPNDLFCSDYPQDCIIIKNQE